MKCVGEQYLTLVAKPEPEPKDSPLTPKFSLGDKVRTRYLDKSWTITRIYAHSLDSPLGAQPRYDITLGERVLKGIHEDILTLRPESEDEDADWQQRIQSTLDSIILQEGDSSPESRVAIYRIVRKIGRPHLAMPEIDATHLIHVHVRWDSPSDDLAYVTLAATGMGFFRITESNASGDLESSQTFRSEYAHLLICAALDRHFPAPAPQPKA